MRKTNRQINTKVNYTYVYANLFKMCEQRKNKQSKYKKDLSLRGKLTGILVYDDNPRRLLNFSRFSCSSTKMPLAQNFSSIGSELNELQNYKSLLRVLEMVIEVEMLTAIKKLGLILTVQLLLITILRFTVKKNWRLIKMSLGIRGLFKKKLFISATLLTYFVLRKALKVDTY